MSDLTATTLTRRAALSSGLAVGAAGVLGGVPDRAEAASAAVAAAPTAEAAPIERVEFRSSGRRIVANFRAGQSDAIVVMSHGFQSDKSSAGRFDYLSEVFNGRGYATLALDYTGSGESEDGPITVASGVEDLTAALAYSRSRGYSRPALYGNSWGTGISLRASTPDVGAFVLTGAGTDAIHYAWPRYFEKSDLEELERTGSMTVPDPNENDWRDTNILSQQSLDDFDETEQEPLLSPIIAPVLIINGDKGWEERTLLRANKRGLQYLPDESRLVIFHGAEHSLTAYLEPAGALAIQWLEEYHPVQIES